MSNNNNCCQPKDENTPSCCPPPPEKPESSCCDTSQSSPCGTEKPKERPGYSINPFVCGWLETPVEQVPQVETRLQRNDHLGRWAMRWGIGRNHYRVTPGLYALGSPDEGSPVLVSANYKLSFDALRSSLKGINAWILVIDTKGVNVWCAAGKGTFGTDEIIRRCNSTELERVVSHRQLIVPQLGAPGVAAHLVKKGTGFTVIYGPVRATDLPEFISAGMKATPSMRRVTFTPLERLVLTPVEITVMRKTILYSIIALFLLSGIGSNFFSLTAAWERGIAALVPGLVGIISGCIVTPVLLPWLPGRLFAIKGAIVGLFASAILILSIYHQASALELIALMLFVCAIASYTAMNFTGSSTFTSPSGVEKEMRLSIPWQAGAILVAGLIWIGTAF